LEYETAGDPMTGLKWTLKTTDKISLELSLAGISVSSVTVGKIVRDLGFSLKSNVKKISNGGKKKTREEEEKRDAQFNYIAHNRNYFREKGYASISCDTKKRKLSETLKTRELVTKRKQTLLMITISLHIVKVKRPFMEIMIGR